MRLDLDPWAIFGCNTAKWTILCIVVHFQPVIKLLQKGVRVHQKRVILMQKNAKGTSLGGNTSFEPFSVRIGATVRPGRVTEKKNSITKKVTSGLYFPYLGGSPRWADSTLKLHGGWCPRRNHVCQVSNLNLHGLRFYRGSNFRFLYWF